MLVSVNGFRLSLFRYEINSAIGRNKLKDIDSRLQQDFSENGNIPFGGNSIILIDDLGQLHPL